MPVGMNSGVVFDLAILLMAIRLKAHGNRDHCSPHYFQVNCTLMCIPKAIPVVRSGQILLMPGITFDARLSGTRKYLLY
jgi:hypothetical protein